MSDEITHPINIFEQSQEKILFALDIGRDRLEKIYNEIINIEEYRKVCITSLILVAELIRTIDSIHETQLVLKKIILLHESLVNIYDKLWANQKLHENREVYSSELISGFQNLRFSFDGFFRVIEGFERNYNNEWAMEKRFRAYMEHRIRSHHSKWKIDQFVDNVLFVGEKLWQMREKFPIELEAEFIQPDIMKAISQLNMLTPSFIYELERLLEEQFKVSNSVKYAISSNGEKSFSELLNRAIISLPHNVNKTPDIWKKHI